jgi:hypothetical protein
MTPKAKVTKEIDALGNIKIKNFCASHNIIQKPELAAHICNPS